MSRDILQSTMTGLEAGLQVKHITTFDLLYCHHEDNVTEVLSDSRFLDIDYLPVKDGDRYVGVFRRKQGDITGQVSQHTRLLDDSMLVSAEQPLPQFIPLMVESPYRLVVMGTKIQGIVTRSDVLKLPVRLFTFTLVTHLEMVMADVIRARCADEQEWMTLLSPNRRERVLSKAEKLKQCKLNTSLLLFTEFCDKRNVVSKLCALGGTFVRDLVQIEELRNAVAHASDYVVDEQGLRDFVETLALIRHWIDVLGAKSVPSYGAQA